MNLCTFVRHVSVVFLLMLVVLPRDVHAYLDPGTGSLVFQTIVAALAAGAYALRSYWSRIRMFFSRNSSQHADDPADRT